MHGEALPSNTPLWKPQDILPYTVGALLYSPALNKKITSMIAECKYATKYSLAMCLEDSISDTAIGSAEEQLCITLHQINELFNNNPEFWIPKIFIRIREPKQLLSIFDKIKNYEKIITGFIFPKYTAACAGEFINNLKTINQYCSHTIYMMPIIESSDIINPAARASSLTEIKKQLMEHSEHVLNIRVGGNDFCKVFGIRRQYDNTIYEISAINNILGDIISVFSNDFIVSGPVFEYFAGSDDNWKKGLFRETRQDLLNGFIGKTVIHPNQIEVVNKALQVRTADYNDALRIFNYKKDKLQVEKSSDGTRMNEIKTHLKWAEKTLKLSQIYGVESDGI